MKVSFFVCLLVFSVSCTKKAKFKRQVQSEWNIDKVEYISAANCPNNSYYDITSTEENIGKIIFTDEEVDSPVAYSVTDKQFIGYWVYENGQTSEFYYEISGKVYGGSQLTIFGSDYLGLNTELLTKDNLIFTINDYNGDCYYNAIRYVLSK